MEELKEKIDWKALSWVIGWFIIGVIVRPFLKDPDLYQPWYAWGITTLFIESVMLLGSILISSLITSVIVKDHMDLFELWARGQDFDDNSSIGHIIQTILTFISFISFNIFFLRMIINS